MSKAADMFRRPSALNESPATQRSLKLFSDWDVHCRKVLLHPNLTLVFPRNFHPEGVNPHIFSAFCAF